MKCPKCGAENSKTQDYCSLCQTSFSNAGEKQANPAPAASIDPFHRGSSKSAQDLTTSTTQSYDEAQIPDTINPAYVGPQSYSQKLTSEEKAWAMMAHLSLFIFGIIAPIIIFFAFRKKSTFIADQAKEAINFQVSYSIYATILIFMAIFMYKLILFFLIAAIAMGLFAFVLMVLAAIGSFNGVTFHYPFTLSLVK